MKTLRSHLSALVFTLALTVPAFGGEIQTTYTSPPPPPGEIQTTAPAEITTGESGAVETGAPGEITTMQATLGLLRILIGLF